MTITIPGDMPLAILTYRQWEDATARRIAAEHDVSMREVRESLPGLLSRDEWRTYVRAAFDAGAHMPLPLWRTLDPDTRRSLLRTPRALSDPTLTSHLTQAVDW